MWWCVTIRGGGTARGVPQGRGVKCLAGKPRNVAIWSGVLGREGEPRMDWPCSEKSRRRVAILVRIDAARRRVTVRLEVESRDGE